MPFITSLLPLEHKQSLLGLSPDEISRCCRRLGLPAFVGKQVAGWIYGKRVARFGEMKNVGRAAQSLLAEHYEIGARPPAGEQRSADGTVKYLYTTADGHFVESVYIPDGERATLCVSSQVGCKMGCAFCMTGRQGYVSSLSVADILNQIYSLPEADTLTNVVFMGQGEPFDNLDAVLRATEVLTAPWGWGWSPKRITVSTVGLQIGLRRFLEESSCHLAISVHHPVPAERAALMPAERGLGIERMVDILRRYDFCRKRADGPRPAEGARQRRLSFEYIVFKGVNDSRQHADALVRLLRPLDCRVNLIRFHDIPDSPLQGVDGERMVWFRDYLTSHGLFTTIRASRGQDIFAACGLLSTAAQEKAKSGVGTNS